MHGMDLALWMSEWLCRQTLPVAAEDSIMLDSILRPVPLSGTLFGKPAPCDFFDARGNLLLREGVTISESMGPAIAARRLYCRAAHAERVTTADPIRTLRDVGEALSMLDELLMAGRRVQAEAFHDLAAEAFAAWTLDADACIGFARMVRFDRPSVCQAVLAALFAAEVGQAQGLAQQDLVHLVGAALTMNLGSLRLHDDMAALGGAPDLDSREALKVHPARAESILIRLGGFPDVWRDAVAQHHENLDGSGYPLGLERSEICLFARMLRVADVLAARLLGRRRRAPQYWSIQKARDPQQLARHVFGPDIGKLDQTLVRMLMHRLGCFPPGSLVRLSNGEMAIINRRTPDPSAAPREALAVLDANGRVQDVPRARRIGPRDCRIQGYAHDDLPRMPEYDWQPIWGYRH